MEFHLHRLIVCCTRIASAPASCLIRSQLQLRRLYFNWVDLPPVVILVGRPAQATQFPLLTLCFAPTMLPVWYPAESEQPLFQPPMLPVCGFRALNETVAHRSHIDIVVSEITSFGYLLLCLTRFVNLTGNTLPFLTDPIGFNTSIEQCFSVFFFNLVSGLKVGWCGWVWHQIVSPLEEM